MVKAYEIAERFNISLRTVYRDIRDLEEGVIPLIGEARQGYLLKDGYRLPPVMFPQEEGMALLLAEKVMGQLSDRGSSQHLNSAMIKIKSVNVYDSLMTTVKTNDLLLNNSMVNEPDESKKKARMKTETPQVPKASKGKRI